MLYHLLPRLEDVHIVFNLFNYLTVRSAGAMASALILMLILGRPFIAFMRARALSMCRATDSTGVRGRR